MVSRVPLYTLIPTPVVARVPGPCEAVPPTAVLRPQVPYSCCGPRWYQCRCVGFCDSGVLPRAQGMYVCVQHGGDCMPSRVLACQSGETRWSYFLTSLTFVEVVASHNLVIIGGVKLGRLEAFLSHRRTDLVAIDLRVGAGLTPFVRWVCSCVVVSACPDWPTCLDKSAQGRRTGDEDVHQGGLGVARHGEWGLGSAQLENWGAAVERESQRRWRMYHRLDR